MKTGTCRKEYSPITGFVLKYLTILSEPCYLTCLLRLILIGFVSLCKCGCCHLASFIYNNKEYCCLIASGSKTPVECRSVNELSPFYEEVLLYCSLHMVCSAYGDSMTLIENIFYLNCLLTLRKAWISTNMRSYCSSSTQSSRNLITFQIHFMSSSW